MSVSRWWFLGGIIFALVWGCVAIAAGPEQTPSVDERLDTIEKDVKEIKELLKALAATSSNQLQRQIPSSPDVTVSFDQAPIKGDPKAALILVEFSDYQCPFCGRFFRSTLPEIDNAYIQTGKLRHVLKDFPLPMHSHAAQAAEAADCAGAQGKYWEMHDLLFNNQQALGLQQLTAYANSLKLDMKAFDNCMSSGTFKDKIARDIAEGQRIGVSGTPSFILGVTTDGRTIKGSVITGARPFPFFQEQIDSKLAPPAAH
jgi:protein-disulfide isomerase